jgi:hypothetical protein
MSSSGKDGNSHKKSLRRRDRGGDDWQNHGKKRGGEHYRFDKTRGVMYDRPKWTPAKLSADPLPAPNCPICGKPIKDIASAIVDRVSGMPAHFDCIISKVSENEIVEKGETVTYIGGGRFGIVNFADPQYPRNFKIKKIIEWEDTANRAAWRQTVADHYSLT